MQDIELYQHKGDSDPIQGVIFSPDRRWITWGSTEESLQLWDAETGRKLQKLEGHSKTVKCVAFSPDGRQIASGSFDRTVRLWDAVSGRELRKFEVPSIWVTSVAFSPDGRRIALGGWENTLRLWDAETGKELRKFEGYSTSVRGVAFSPDGKRIASATEYQTLRMWEAEAGQQERKLDEGWSGISGVVFSQDGRRIALGSNKKIRLWDANTGRELFERSVPKVRKRVALLLSGLFSRMTWFRWILYAFLEQTTKFEGHSDYVKGVAFSPDGRTIASGSSDNTLRLWNTETGRELRKYKGHSFGIFSVAFSPDGHRIASASGDDIRLWDIESGQDLRKFEGIAMCVAFSPNGRWITSGSQLWDVDSGRELQKFAGHPGAVWSVVFSPDGRRIASGGGDNTVRLWEAATGRELRKFEGHSGSVNGVAFSPDGRRLVSGSDDCTMRLWDIATGDELVQMINWRDGNWLVMTPEGLFDGSTGGRQKVMYRIGGGLDVVPVDRFFQDFYYPGLLAAIWRGERPLPQVEFGKQQPPKIAILSPKEAETSDSPEVTIEVEVTDQGGGISGPTLRQNGAKVLAGGLKRQDGKTVRQTFTIQLVEGENRLRVEAASSDGSWESEPAKLTLNYTKSLAKPDLYVLAVGVNQYAEKSLNLSYAAKDAEALADLFRQRGTSLYAEVHVSPLLNAQATKKGIREALSAIAKAAKPQDALLVFFSGHGYTVGQRYYFIPHEFRQESERFEDDVRKSGLPIDEIGDALSAIPALKRMLILDTCNSGAAISKSGGKARNPFAFRGAIERLSRAEGIFTIAASAATEETVEVKEIQHGVLTYSLLAALKGVDSGPLADKWVRPTTSDQVVGVLDWFSFASGEVPRLTKQFIGQEQDVKMSGEGTSFPVLPLDRR